MSGESMSFDEWNKYNLGYVGREAYEAGAQSRQDEIDEKQNRIDKALIQVSNHYHSCVARKDLKQMSASISEIAEIEAHEANMAVLENILKGKEND